MRDAKAARRRFSTARMGAGAGTAAAFVGLPTATVVASRLAIRRSMSAHTGAKP
jgi:hypothetical protein